MFRRSRAALGQLTRNASYGKREAYNGVENRDVCIEFLGGLGSDMMDFMDFFRFRRNCTKK